MARPILSWKDKRVLKLKDTHAVLCFNASQKRFMFFNIDNQPEPWLGWKPVKLVKASRSGLTISESIYEMNCEISKLVITKKDNPNVKITCGR